MAYAFAAEPKVLKGLMVLSCSLMRLSLPLGRECRMAL